MRYVILYSKAAETDIRQLRYLIRDKYKAPLTAARYVQGLYDEIKQLERIPESFPVQARRSLLQYGTNVRRINYKKTAIIYTVHRDIVYIHRIVAGSMITDL